MELHHPDSNRIGCFNVLYDEHDARLRALLEGCTVLQVEPHESGRGKAYYAASPMFEPLADKAEIPEYRIEGEQDGGKWTFKAIRKTIIRVPPVSVHVSANL
jgi:hypothetical protein